LISILSWFGRHVGCSLIQRQSIAERPATQSQQQLVTAIFTRPKVTINGQKLAIEETATSTRSQR
jgi:hypothetical protein